MIHTIRPTYKNAITCSKLMSQTLTFWAVSFNRAPFPIYPEASIHRPNERALAFNQYEICLKTLQRVCAVEPERETRELFERIRLRPESI